MDLIENQIYFRLSFSLGGLILFWLLALLFPFRKSSAFKDTQRILANLLFSFGNGIIIKLLIPLGLVEMAFWRFEKFPKLFSIGSGWMGLLFGVLFLDMAIYWQHRAFHKWDLFWRLHRMHHSDIEIDTTSAGRFHIVEILISFFYKAFWVLLLGVHPIAIIIFEILLNFSSLFNHSNFQLPGKLERFLRYILITPDLHRIHHSVQDQEMNRNFGFSTSLWDRLFFSYLQVSSVPQGSMQIGLERFRKRKQQSFSALLKQPLENQKPKRDNQTGNPES